MNEMKVVSIGKGSDNLLIVPKAPVYLNDEAKKHYKEMGNILAKNNRMKEIFLPALIIYAESMAQFEFAISEIRRKNKEKQGSGYVQKFATGAQNISVEVSLKKSAIDDLLKFFKIFGMDPKSEKELKDITDPNQGNLFEEMLKMKKGQ
jgi:phage terminase small subunit